MTAALLALYFGVGAASAAGYCYLEGREDRKRSRGVVGMSGDAFIMALVALLFWPMLAVTAFPHYLGARREDRAEGERALAAARARDAERELERHLAESRLLVLRGGRSEVEDDEEVTAS